MNILTSSPTANQGRPTQMPSPTNSKPSEEVSLAGKDQVELGSELGGGESKWMTRLLGAAAGAVVGGFVGGNPGSAASVTGLGVGAGTVTTLGPAFAETVKEGLNGDPINDFALTTSALFAGGITLTAFSAAAGLSSFALDQALPGSGRLLSAAAGAFAGAGLADRLS